MNYTRYATCLSLVLRLALAQVFCFLQDRNTIKFIDKSNMHKRSHYIRPPIGSRLACYPSVGLPAITHPPIRTLLTQRLIGLHQ